MSKKKSAGGNQRSNNYQKMNATTQAASFNTEYPLWKPTLAALRALPTFGYGLKLDVSWFEHQLGCKRDSSEFAFGFLTLRQRVESEDGYYLGRQTTHREEDGVKEEVVVIPSAAEHEEVAKSFESSLKNYASRAAHIRAKTLDNPAATLSDEERRKMQKSLEIAAVRAVLLRREKAVIKVVEARAPKLLK